MRSFFDTSVLVAASTDQHPNYANAFAALTRVVDRKETGYISCHSMAELYSTLSRLPLQPRMHPMEVLRILEENVVPQFRTVVLDERDYRDAIERCATQGLSGGIVYDALLLACARKSRCERIYTLNVSQFRLLDPALSERISAP